MTLFKGYVAVDWSASTTPVHGATSIWIAVCDAGGMQELVNPHTRQDAMDHIETLLNKATAEGRRLICGFDFSFGYPERTARRLTGCDSWKAVWERIAELSQDGPNNQNNSLQVAAVLNEAFVGEGPFWGRPATPVIPGLLATRPRFVWGANVVPRLRFAECLVPQAREVWQLYGAGSVGRQALTGIFQLQGLRTRRNDVQVWPFETLGEGRSHVLAEIYPSLIDPCPGDEVLDARQVTAVAETLRELDRREELGEYLRAPNDMPARVIKEEGLILGMQDPEGFQAAAREIPCRLRGVVPLA